MHVNINRLTLSIGLVLAGACSIALGAWLHFPIPGTFIPQTGQTIAVITCGALLGWQLGTIAVLVYLLLGALGLPVYSDGGSGLMVLTGGSAGYFAGFVAAALFTGLLLRPLPYSVTDYLRAFLIILAAHGIILLLGAFWLSTSLGPAQAYGTGIAPFYYGAFVKSLLTCVLLIPAGILDTRRLKKLTR